MRNHEKDRHIGPELFDLFLRSGIYRQYAERFMNPGQIDEVNIAQYLSRPALNLLRLDPVPAQQNRQSGR